MTRIHSEIANKTLDYIKRNRVSTTEVADCLNKTGVLSGVLPINRGHFRAGFVRWVYAYDETNWHVHEQIPSLQEGEVLLVEAFNCKERAIFGDLVSKYVMLYRQAEGIVVQGRMRDVPRLIKENWPIWCTGITPIGCFNHAIEQPFDPATIVGRREQFDGAIAVCDDCGVVVVPKLQITNEFLRKLEFIEHQEDVWYECIDKRKMNTFETVCLKTYLKAVKDD